ncbi:class I lanthipeptide [Lacinutrix sp.]|uniref:class I lanthipeptide n=1 Tax=Lacinutrix sp. TaxID=1937692 RepID=UPI0025BBC722|nr:class I lanthipeptide [Lacinutrix sp.]
MKTLNKKLEFNKSSLIELDNSQMDSINGGSTTFFVDWVQDQIDEAKEQMSPWI